MTGVLTDDMIDVLAIKALLVTGIGRRVGAGMQTSADIDPDDPLNIKSLSALEWTQACPQSARLKDSAFKNM